MENYLIDDEKVVQITACNATPTTDYVYLLTDKGRMLSLHWQIKSEKGWEPVWEEIKIPRLKKVSEHSS